MMPQPAAGTEPMLSQQTDGAMNGGPNPAPRPATRVGIRDAMHTANTTGGGTIAAASVAAVAAMGTARTAGMPGPTDGGGTSIAAAGAMVGDGTRHVCSSAAAEAAASSILGPAGGVADPRLGRRRNACAA